MVATVAYRDPGMAGVAGPTRVRMTASPTVSRCSELPGVVGRSRLSRRTLRPCYWQSIRATPLEGSTLVHVTLSSLKGSATVPECSWHVPSAPSLTLRWAM